MILLEILKEEMKKSFKAIYENTNTRRKKNKTVQDIKMESVEKTQTKGNLEVKNEGTQTGNSEASLTNRTQEMEERIPDTEDTIKERDTLVKENAKSKRLLV